MGWDFENDTVTNSMVLYAKYNEASYTVDFITYFTGEETIVATQTVPRWGTSTAPTDVIDPYRGTVLSANGWYQNKDYFNNCSCVEEDNHVVAVEQNWQFSLPITQNIKLYYCISSGVDEYENTRSSFHNVAIAIDSISVDSFILVFIDRLLK